MALATFGFPLSFSKAGRSPMALCFAADYLNGLLESNPRFKLDREYAAASPIKVGVMRTWLRVYLNREWKANKRELVMISTDVMSLLSSGSTLVIVGTENARWWFGIMYR